MEGFHIAEVYKKELLVWAYNLPKTGGFKYRLILKSSERHHHGDQATELTDLL